MPYNHFSKIFWLALGLVLDTILITEFLRFSQTSLFLYSESFVSFLAISLAYFAGICRHFFKNDRVSLAGWVPGILVFAAILFAFEKSVSTVCLSLGIAIQSAFYLQNFSLALLLLLFRRKAVFSLESFRDKCYSALFFLGLQCVYGALFFYATPNIFEFNLQYCRPDLSIFMEYPTKSGIHFFYRDRELADRIEKELPQVVHALERSPFFGSAQSLWLYQDRRLPGAEEINGLFIPSLGVSYYFPLSPLLRHPVEGGLDSRANSDYATPLHELTHQMVSQYFGKYWMNYIIPKWKDEGYAEYMVAIDSYSDKSELLGLLEYFEVPLETLSDPFRKESTAEDTIAAFLQTRYAIDSLKMEPQDFFSPLYRPQAGSKIYVWLKTPVTENESNLV